MIYIIISRPWVQVCVFYFFFKMTCSIPFTFHCKTTVFPRCVILDMIWNTPFVLNVFPIVWELLFLPLAILQKANHLCQNLKKTNWKKEIPCLLMLQGNRILAHWSLTTFYNILRITINWIPSKVQVLKQYATKY